MDIGPAPLQEAHVRNCLEGGGNSSAQSAKYLVYKLPEESALIGTECEHSHVASLYRNLITGCRCNLSGRVRQRYVCTLQHFGPTPTMGITGSTVARLSCLCSFHNGGRSMRNPSFYC
jgi:hypothetical protein